jgi:hypothetical protein
MEKRSDTISRVRNLIKGTKQKDFLTDRFLYSLVLKYAKLYLKRLDDQNKIMRFQSLFVTLPCVELEEVDKVEACCGGIKSGCIIKRTKYPLPDVFEGTYGPLFRTISSIDGSFICIKTNPATFTDIANSSTFKYNRNKYYWYIDKRLYFPNIEWDAVKVEILPEGTVESYLCDGDVCKLRQDEQTHIPEYLFAEIEQNVKNDLLGTIQIPKEGLSDNQSALKQ